MKTHKTQNAPEGATHYNEPYYYKVTNGDCRKWSKRRNTWVSSSWKAPGLLADKHTMRVNHKSWAKPLMQYPNWRKRQNRLD